MVDSGEPFFTNSKKLFESFSTKIEDILYLVGKRITVGELIAHLVSINNLEDVNKTMSALLGNDVHGKPRKFWEELASFRSPEADAGIESDLVIQEFLPEAETSYQLLIELFRLRHIYVHEIVALDQIVVSKIKDLCSAANKFGMAFLKFVSEQVSPGSTALTQAGMNLAASDSYTRANEKVNALFEELRNILPEQQAQALESAASLWETYMTREFDSDWNPYDGGSAGVAWRISARARLVELRAQFIAGRLESAKWIDSLMYRPEREEQNET